MKLNRKFIALALVALLLSLTALSASAQGNPTVRFTSPAPNSTVSGPDVTITWDSTGVTIVPAADAKQLTEGHYHLFLDKEANVQDGVEIPRGDPQIIHTADKQYKWANVAQGQHTVTVVVSYSDHKPWVPRTMATMSFTVGGASAPSTLPRGGAEQTMEWALVVGALLSAAILVFAFSRKLRAIQ